MAKKVSKSKSRSASSSSSSDAKNNKTIAVLAYLLFFIPLVTTKKSKFAMHHANQSLILLIIWVSLVFLSGMVPILGGMVSFVAGIGVFVLWIMGIISAANGSTKPLPIIGGYTLIK